MFSFGLLKSRLPCQEEAVHMCMHSLFCMSSLDYIICGGGADPQPRALHHRFRSEEPGQILQRCRRLHPFFCTLTPNTLSQEALLAGARRWGGRS